MNLYEITNEYQDIFDQLEKAEGEDRLPLVTRLDEIKAPLEMKATNLAKYISNLRASQKALDDEIERLERMKKSIQRKEYDMMNYLEFNMKKCGILKIDSTLFKIQFQKCPQKVEVINDAEIPDEYKRTKTETTIDKIKIKEELKVGVVIPGVQLVQSEKLVIK